RRSARERAATTVLVRPSTAARAQRSASAAHPDATCQGGRIRPAGPAGAARTTAPEGSRPYGARRTRRPRDPTFRGGDRSLRTDRHRRGTASHGVPTGTGHRKALAVHGRRTRHRIALASKPLGGNGSGRG